jgi:hypothetical protein
MQKKRPKLKEADKTQINDAFHLIVESDFIETPTEMRTSSPGIDVINNRHECIISI